jgi:hypothetical protein
MCTGDHPFIPAADTAVVRMIYQTPGGEAMNVLHFSNPSGWSSSSLLDLCTAVDDSWETNFRDAASVDITLKEVTAQDVSVEEGAGNSLVVLSSGTAASPVLPSNVTLAISFRSGFAGRSRRGRMFFVGLYEAAVTGDQLTAGGQAAMIGRAQDFFADIATAVPDTQHVVVSYCHDGAWRTEGLVTPITSYLVDNTTDSMRKRLLGRGR